jgi:hypothetical protein
MAHLSFSDAEVPVRCAAFRTDNLKFVVRVCNSTDGELLSPATEWRLSRAGVVAHRRQRQRGGRLAVWAVLLDRTQGKERSVLYFGDAGQPRNVQALVAALGP